MIRVENINFSDNVYVVNLIHYIEYKFGFIIESIIKLIIPAISEKCILRYIERFWSDIRCPLISKDNLSVIPLYIQISLFISQIIIYI